MYGVIDIGSNTIRLVIYKVENGKIKPLLNKKHSAGLASYINKKNRMKSSGIQKAVTILKEFKEIVENMNLQAVFPFATASLRNIENTQEVLNAVKENCGFDVRVLTGSEEAVFDYYGAVQSMEERSGLLVDIGGGSTELVFYKDREVVATESLPVGSLSLFNRFVADIMPTKVEMSQISEEILRLLKTIHLPDYALSFEHICGVGGTARATLTLLRDLDAQQAQDAQYNSSYLWRLLEMAQQDARGFARQILKSSPERVHTLIPGIVALKTIAEHYGSKAVTTSNYGVREGYLHYLLEERGELHGT